VERFITENFVPVKIHIKEQPATFERFGVQWTPTFVIYRAARNDGDSNLPIPRRAVGTKSPSGSR